MLAEPSGSLLGSFPNRLNLQQYSVIQWYWDIALTLTA